METTFINKCHILADLWMNYRDDEEFEEFFEYNDLGLPLSYLISSSIIDSTPIAEGFVTEAFALFLDGLDLDDQGFENLEDILGL